MRTSVDIPDDLFKRAKIEAARTGRTLKEMLVVGLGQQVREVDGADGEKPSLLPIFGMLAEHKDEVRRIQAEIDEEFGSPTSMSQRVAAANRKLPSAGLVTAHSGNVSGLKREAGLVYIKPSGINYDNLTCSQVVAVHLTTGEPLAGQLKPSVDLPQHLFLYRNMPEIGGVVHTHSNYATAFAACGMPIPCVLTAVADEFGGEIPCMPYVDNQGDAIGEAILKHKGRGPAILLGSHGVFTWGPTPEAALKAAIMVEDTAKTIWLAMQIGKPTPFPPEEIAKWWDRYHSTYGQSET